MSVDDSNKLNNTYNLHDLYFRGVMLLTRVTPTFAAKSAPVIMDDFSQDVIV